MRDRERPGPSENQAKEALDESDIVHRLTQNTRNTALLGGCRI